jgi:tRNA G18 (ribose-2'-O)-methylase SpoU
MPGDFAICILPSALQAFPFCNSRKITPVRITWRERQRRIRASLGEAWETGARPGEDLGLRAAYEDIPKAPIRLIALPLNKDVNHGGLLRIADAFRLERVDLCRAPDRAIDFSGNRGTSQWQPYRWTEPEEAVQDALKDGFTLCALTLSPQAVDIMEVQWQFPLAIVLGSEVAGVPAEIEERCELAAAIPMYGLVTSLNVATAAAIVVQQAIRAYAMQNPEFQPVRSASRRLLGLEPETYSPSD